MNTPDRPDLQVVGSGGVVRDIEPVSPFVVEQIADNTPDDAGIHQVRVSLTDQAWRVMVGDVARALYSLTSNSSGGGYALFLAAGRPGNDLDREDALTRLVQRLGVQHDDAPRSWLLEPGTANAVAVALDTAAEEPSTCETCGRFVEAPSSLSVLTGCARCSARRFGDGS